MDPGGFRFFGPPEGDPVRLEMRPQLASWDAKGHPSQVRLTAFLDHMEERLDEGPLARLQPSVPLGLRLRVGFEPGVDLRRFNDLDNYLEPILRRLGATRFASARAEKGVGPSSLTVGLCPRSEPPSGNWEFAWATSSLSASTKPWKSEIRDQIAQRASPASPGSLSMHLAFVIGPRRVWLNLLKPAIDSLGPILGSRDRRPFHPDDERIVRLGLHVTVDEERRNDVAVGCWWRALPQPDEGLGQGGGTPKSGQ